MSVTLDDLKAIRCPAFDVVAGADHPSPERGGPCATCAFREGTEASQTLHTVALARLCVEGLTPFYCHENPGLCRGFVAAANLRGEPKTKADRARMNVCRAAGAALSEAIAAGVQADQAARELAENVG